MQKDKLPEWAPAQATPGFTTTVRQGVPMPTSVSTNASSARRNKLSIDDYVQGVLQQDRTILARAITLVESNSAAHMELAQQVLKQLLPHTGKSVRIGVTGVPGAGKSTFIESFGCLLLSQGKKCAVLAIDPSSSVSGGSVLGDKTRMEELSRQPGSFIRPSPSGGTLGGVTRKTRETILLCEAAGFDTIIVETVGVGQNETTVRQMVDFFLLLKIAGAGDELQGIKKGVVELADAVVINKADGDNITRAQVAQQDFANALHYLRTPTPGWQPPALTCSSINKTGLTDIAHVIEQFVSQLKQSGFWQQRRSSQMLDWTRQMLKDYLLARFYSLPAVKTSLPGIEQQVLKGQLPPTAAVLQLLELYK